MSHTATLVLLPTRRRLETRLATVYRELLGVPLGYPGEGGTRDGTRPPGYSYLRRQADVGTGTEDFQRAAAFVRAWGTHLGSGLRVYPEGVPQEPGSAVLIAIGMGPIAIIAPCRVVWTVDEPARAGFGYGTLPGHPEEGEEAFVVELEEATGRVRFTVTAFSRHAAWYTKLAGPVGRLAQRRAAKAYIDAVRSSTGRAGTR